MFTQNIHFRSFFVFSILFSLAIGKQCILEKTSEISNLEDGCTEIIGNVRIENITKQFYTPEVSHFISSENIIYAGKFWREISNEKLRYDQFYKYRDIIFY